MELFLFSRMWSPVAGHVPRETQLLVALAPWVWACRQYFSENHIDRKLSSRVWHFHNQTAISRQRLRCMLFSFSLGGDRQSHCPPAVLGHILELFFSFWSRDLVQKLRAVILYILAVSARRELHYEAHFWPKTYSD